MDLWGQYTCEAHLEGRPSSSSKFREFKLQLWPIKMRVPPKIISILHHFGTLTLLFFKAVKGRLSFRMPRPAGTLMPFLYPCFYETTLGASTRRLPSAYLSRRLLLTTTATSEPELEPKPEDELDTRLNPSPDDYGRSIFADKCNLILFAGSGGNGCVSFLREKFIAEGPANGGDGGSGGNIFIQAIESEKSLHKLARQGVLRAGKGKHGQGKGKGGQRGEDVLIQVPVGTVLRETSRYDPVQVEGEGHDTKEEQTPSEGSGGQQMVWTKDKWLLAPSSMPSDFTTAQFPALPRPRRSNLAAMQPPSPIFLDLSKPMAEPIVLAAGALGGLGNPHFVTRSIPRPKFATKGDGGMRLELELELKLLADLGFVGMPNAGKSTLLRSLSRSRARVGDWAFTTLQPNIGTVVLDNNEGRAKVQAFDANGKRRTQFSIADIPGLVPDAHLDRGLGLDFLRHVERAKVLAFIIDLSHKNPIEILKTLWRELDEFEKLKDFELNRGSEQRIVSWRAFGSAVSSENPDTGTVIGQDEPSTLYRSRQQSLPLLEGTPISSKPWFVVANKADLDNTMDKFSKLQEYLEDIPDDLPGRKNRWKGRPAVIPVSAIRGEGVEQIVKQAALLLQTS